MRDKIETRIIDAIDMPTCKTYGKVFHQVYKILNDSPNLLSQAEIAKLLGTSRQRVNQIITSHIELKSLLRKKGYYCQGCGIRFLSKSKTGFCKECKPKSNSNANTIMIICHTCKTPFYRKSHQMRSKSNIFFCSRKCKGKWLGKNYGKNRRGVKNANQ